MNSPAPESSSSPATPPSLRRRMACWLYEGVLMFGVVWIAGYLFGTLTQTRNALDNRMGLQLFLFVIFGIYFVWFWHKGQTLAMKTWHLRVVDRAGQAISQKRCATCSPGSGFCRAGAGRAISSASRGNRRAHARLDRGLCPALALSPRTPVPA
jgi:hypothetical protein